MANTSANRFYFAIGLTNAFAEFLRMPLGTVNLTDFMRLHALLFSAVTPRAGKLRSRGTEVIVFGRAAAASFDICSEMRLASIQFAALMRSANNPLDLITAIVFMHARIIYIQPAAEGNECATQVLSDMQLRRMFDQTDLGAWPGNESYARALTKAARGDLAPIIRLVNARLKERKVVLPADCAMQSPFDVLSRNWTALDKRRPDVELLLCSSRFPSS